MKRNCPSCNNESISVLHLMFTRVRCSDCQGLIGHHWIYNVVFCCFGTVLLGGFAVYLQTILLPAFATACMFVAVLSSALFLSAALGPLEQKGNILTP